MEPALGLAVVFFTAFVIVFLVVPPFIKRMHKQGLTGKDMNKYQNPPIAEMGGAMVFLGFSFGLFGSIFIATYLHWFDIQLSMLLAGFCTIAMMAFIGVVDDLIGWKKGIRQWQHTLFPVIAALPLMAIQAGETTMTFPFFGVINLGVVYALVVIPIGITGASNAFNMLAGFNGLEAGQGVVLTLALTIIAFASGQITAVIFGIAMIGALLAFLCYNWFPAKIFGGDSLTLMVGANLAVMSILGNMETYGVLILSLFAVEFFIKAKHKFQSECFGIPQKDNTLKANPKGGSFTHLILRFKPMREMQLTMSILIIQAILCAGILALFFVAR